MPKKLKYLITLPIVVAVVGVLNLLGNIDGSINFIQRLHLDTIPWFTLLRGLISILSLSIPLAVAFLLWQYFKGKEDLKSLKQQMSELQHERELTRALFSFYVHYDSMHLHEDEMFGSTKRKNQQLNTYMYDEMNRIWGEEKADSEINYLVRTFLGRLGA